MTSYVSTSVALRDDVWYARTTREGHAYVTNQTGILLSGTADNLLALAAALEGAASLLVAEATVDVAAVVDGHGPAAWRNAEGDVQ